MGELCLRLRHLLSHLSVFLGCLFLLSRFICLFLLARLEHLGSTRMGVQRYRSMGVSKIYPNGRAKISLDGSI